MEDKKPLRLVIAEDTVILRDGMVELLTARGCEVLATTDTPEGLHEAVRAHAPDVAIVDIRLPPTFTDEGIRAAEQLRVDHPDLGVLVFSQHADSAWAARVLRAGAHGVGYLLKERVAAVSQFIEALHRVAEGGTALDPEIVDRMMRGGQNRLDRLSSRERQALELMAQGFSNKSIAAQMFVSERAVEKHAAAVFGKFDLPLTDGDNRRVKAVVAYLTEVRH